MAAGSRYTSRMDDRQDMPPDDVLNTQLIQRCNPGLSDFGAGSVIALSSQCLRSAKLATACSICIDACPANALRANSLQRPSFTKDCLKCGYCISICPVNAITATTKTIQQIIRVLLQSTLRVSQLTLTCNRSLALLRLAAESLQGEEATAALAHLLEAEKSDNLYVVPCLAMLSSELWFTLLNEIGISAVDEILVFLPFGQCELCPVNDKEGAVDAFSAAIDTAEQWSGQTVTIVSSASQVPQYRKADLRGYLADASQTDRRSVFTGLLDELKRSWDDTNRTGNRAADEALMARARRETINRTVLADDLPSLAAGQVKPVLSVFRQALVEAIGRNPSNAGHVSLLASETDTSLCDACGSCVDACPLKARQIVSGKAYADPLYCLGCSACLQICPKQACSFIRISGQIFLRE